MFLQRKISPCQIISSYKGFLQPFRLTGNCPLKMERIGNQTDKTVSDDDVQNITRMTSKSICSTLVKRIQIPPTAQSKYNSLYNISGIIDWVESLLTPEQEPFNTKS